MTRAGKRNGFERLLIAILCLAIVLPAASVAAAAKSSDDWSGHWAEKQLGSWLAQGLLQGYEDGSVKPEQAITRAEWIALVNRAFGLQEMAELTAPDVSTRDWAYNDIAIAVKAGYISGYEDQSIKPERPVSRQEAAVMVARLLRLDTSVSPSSETAEDMPAWSRGAWNAVAAGGFIPFYAGDPTGFAKPVTRAEAVAILDAAKREKIVAYEQPGTYGPESGRQVVEGNVLLAAGGITLRNTTITGNLTIGEQVGEGEVTLDNVEVAGTAYVHGGGVNSIYFKDAVIVRITINKKTGDVRIVAEGKTSVNQVQVQSGARIDNSKATSGGFSNIKLEDKLPSGSKVSLLGNFESVDISSKNVSVEVPNGSINQLTVASNAAGSQLSLGNNAVISSLVLKAPLTVSGEGKIEKASIEKGAEGSTFQTPPVSLEESQTATSPSNPNPAPSTNPDPSTSPEPEPSPNPEPNPDPDPTTDEPLPLGLVSATASNGTIIVTMTDHVPAGIAASDFVVVQRVQGGAETTLHPSAVNGAGKTAVITVPPVAQTAVEQTVSYRITYNGSTIDSNAFQVGAAPVVTALVYEPNVTVTSGTYQLSVIAQLSDMSTIDLTNETLPWTSSDDTVASVSSTGVVTPHSNGTATITVSYGGHTANIVVTVNQGPSIKVECLAMGPSAVTGYPVGCNPSGSYTVAKNDNYKFLYIMLENDVHSVDRLIVSGLGDVSAPQLSSAKIIVQKTDAWELKTYTITLTGVEVVTPSGPVEAAPITFTLTVTP
jgi:hypothetical protein